MINNTLILKRVMNLTSLKRRHTNEKWSTSLIIKEIQIKCLKGYYVNSVRTATVKTKDKNAANL
jgi:hypothetical protein